MATVRVRGNAGGKMRGKTERKPCVAQARQRLLIWSFEGAGERKEAYPASCKEEAGDCPSLFNAGETNDEIQLLTKYELKCGDLPHIWKVIRIRDKVSVAVVELRRDQTNLRLFQI